MVEDDHVLTNFLVAKMEKFDWHSGGISSLWNSSNALSMCVCVVNAIFRVQNSRRRQINNNSGERQKKSQSGDRTFEEINDCFEHTAQ